MFLPSVLPNWPNTFLIIVHLFSRCFSKVTFLRKQIQPPPEQLRIKALLKGSRAKSFCQPWDLNPGLSDHRHESLTHWARQLFPLSPWERKGNRGTASWQQGNKHCPSNCKQRFSFQWNPLMLQFLQVHYWNQWTVMVSKAGYITAYALTQTRGRLEFHP